MRASREQLFFFLFQSILFFLSFFLIIVYSSVYMRLLLLLSSPFPNHFVRPLLPLSLSCSGSCIPKIRNSLKSIVLFSNKSAISLDDFFLVQSVPVFTSSTCFGCFSCSTSALCCSTQNSTRKENQTSRTQKRLDG